MNIGKIMEELPWSNIGFNTAEILVALQSGADIEKAGLRIKKEIVEKTIRQALTQQRGEFIEMLRGMEVKNDVEETLKYREGTLMPIPAYTIGVYLNTQWRIQRDDLIKQLEV